MNYRPILTVAALMLAVVTNAQAELDIQGGWQTREGKSQERDTMTVRSLGQGNYEVEVRTVYCPSKECMNARFGGFAFQSPLSSNQLFYSADGCTVLIRFAPDRATVQLKGCHEEHQYPYGYPRGPFRKFTNDSNWNSR